MTHNYAHLVHEIKTLATQGEEAQVQKMLLLIELHESMLWAEHYRTWKAFLKNEGNLCTPSLFQAFKTATQVLSAKECRQYGVRGSALIGRLPVQMRESVLATLREWWKAHRVPPQYQNVVQQIRKLHPPQKSHAVRASQLLGHIEKLNRMLRRAGVKPPPVPKHPS